MPPSLASAFYSSQAQRDTTILILGTTASLFEPAHPNQYRNEAYGYDVAPHNDS